MVKAKQVFIALAVALTACAMPDRAALGPVGSASISAVPQDRRVYLVQLEDDTPDMAAAIARAYATSLGGHVRYQYRYALKGFSVDLPDAAVEALERNPNVVSIEPDGMVYLTSVGSWGLDRVDQRNLPLDGAYAAPGNSGAGVTVFIIDTGLWATHVEFGGRAVNAVDLLTEYYWRPTPENWDCLGHGTHVAGTVGGATYGVANQVQLVGIRVFICGFGPGASISTIVAAVDTATALAAVTSGPDVVNMSLGGGYSQILNDAVSGSIASGVSYVIAAGNDNIDACTVSPASTPNAVTVGATDSTDRKPTFSNYGPCVDLWAPGVFITSAWTGWDVINNVFFPCGDACTATIHGTSMATPHVTGALALVLSANPTWTPAQARDALVANATAGVLTGLPSGSPDRLLYVGTAGQEPPPPPPPPPPPGDDASFVGSCSGFTCTFTAVSSGSWNFGDGSSGSGVQVSHTFAPRRRYTVTHMVGTDAVGHVVNCNPKKCVVQ